MSDAKDITFSLKVLMNKARTKVLFAETGSDFADVLLSFLTLPLGRIVKIMEKHYGDKAPVFGSLTTLYKGLANLDNVNFWTEGAKLILLNPTSSFEYEYKKLKLDITDSEPAEYFRCTKCLGRYWSVSMYYEDIIRCENCPLETIKKAVAKKEAQSAVCYDGVFTTNTASFVISDDLKILSNEREILQTIRILGLTDTYETKQMNVTFGFNEIMDLLKASLTSPTPLSDLVLNKTSLVINSTTVKLEDMTPSNKAVETASSDPKKMILKVTVRKSTNQILFAQSGEDFVQFLFSFLVIPLGGVEGFLMNKTCIKSIDNVYRSVADLIDKRYFKTSNTKKRLIKPKLPHGYIWNDHIFPLTEESLPQNLLCTLLSSAKFPKGKGIYLKGPRMYKVTDDLTVTPVCLASTLSNLGKLKIPLSDIEEMELHIGLEEGLSILKASLTTTSALSNGLMNHIVKKQPKQEHGV